jgi:serine/threonine protein kinase
MEAPELLRPGYRLDRYELLCPIASGGMATVWLARLRGKRGFEKLFAVKTIRTELVDDTRFQEMFLDEARIASGIQHPNVAQILDLGEQDNVLYLVMEWVDGESLTKIRKLVAKRGAVLPIGIALRVLADACAGLHAAHELKDDDGEALGIVHRDVSPQNILVSTSGVVKLIDFGIAKAQNRKQGETRTGVVKGKIQYLAPEQVKKERRMDRRLDIWALGGCLHELVTGKVPYGEDDDLEVIRKLMADEPPPRAAGIPEPVLAVIDRSLVLDPAARFPTAAAMQRALEAAMVALGETKTSDDVATYVRAECPELSLKRKDIVTRAVDEARGREASGGDAREEAFAPTLMGDVDALSQRGRPSDVGTVELVKRKDATPVAPPAPPAATNSSVELDRDSFVIPKRSLAWLWITLLLGAGVGVAAFRFPAARQRVLVAVGLAGGEAPRLEPSATQMPSASPPVVSASAPSPVALPSASASASASGTPSASASARASASASAAHNRPPAGHGALPVPPEEPAAAEPSSSTPYSIYKTPPAASAPSTPPPAPAPPPPAPSASSTNPY